MHFKIASALEISSQRFLCWERGNIGGVLAKWKSNWSLTQFSELVLERSVTCALWGQLWHSS